MQKLVFTRGQSFLFQRVRPVGRLSVVVDVIFSTAQGVVDGPAGRQREFLTTAAPAAVLARTGRRFRGR